MLRAPRIGQSKRCHYVVILKKALLEGAKRSPGVGTLRLVLTRGSRANRAFGCTNHRPNVAINGGILIARPKRKDQVLQFKITLNNTKPPVWRPIQVPGDYTFWDLHVAIQDSMGWLDYHLNEFEVVNPRKLQVEKIGTPDSDYFDTETLPGWKIPAARLFTSSNPKAKYLYDSATTGSTRSSSRRSFPETPTSNTPGVSPAGGSARRRTSARATSTSGTHGSG